MFWFSSASKSAEQIEFEIKVEKVHQRLFLYAHHKNMENKNKIYLVKYLIFLKMFYTNPGSIKRESTVKDEERMILHDFYEASPAVYEASPAVYEASPAASQLGEEKAYIPDEIQAYIPDEIQRKVDEIYMFVQPKRGSFMRAKPSFLNHSNESEKEFEKKEFTSNYNDLNLNMNSFLSCAISSI